MTRMKLKVNVRVKCNTKPFAEPQFEVNHEKDIFLHCAMQCTAVQCNVMQYKALQCNAV